MEVGVLVVFIVLMVFVWLFSIAACVLAFIANWRIFRKAGVPGWMSIVPFLNVYKEYQIAWKPSIGVLVIVLAAVLGVTGGIVGGLGAVFGMENMMHSSREVFSSDGMLIFFGVSELVMCMLAIPISVLDIIRTVKLGHSFNKSAGFIVGMVFLPLVFNMILAFDNSTYIGPMSGD